MPDKKEEDPFDTTTPDEKIVLLSKERDEAKARADALDKESKSKDENIHKLRERLDKESMKEDRQRIEEAKKSVPFANIRRSTTLKPDEREELTDREVEQMDALADMQERENTRYLEGVERTEKERSHRGEFIRAEALKMADNDTKKANEIIERFGMFKDADEIPVQQVAERLGMAYKLTDSYTAVVPKEQGSTMAAGSAIKEGGANEDTALVDNLISEHEKASEPAVFNL